MSCDLCSPVPEPVAGDWVHASYGFGRTLTWTKGELTDRLGDKRLYNSRTIIEADDTERYVSRDSIHLDPHSIQTEDR